jgi:hypothetical protein
MMQHNNLFGCFQVLMCGQMERQTEIHVQKQSVTNVHCTANIHTTAHNVKLLITQQFFNTPQNDTHWINLKFHLYQQLKYNPDWINLFRRKKVRFL